MMKISFKFVKSCFNLSCLKKIIARPSATNPPLLIIDFMKKILFESKKFSCEPINRKNRIKIVEYIDLIKGAIDFVYCLEKIFKNQFILYKYRNV